MLSLQERGGGANCFGVVLTQEHEVLAILKGGGQFLLCLEGRGR